MKIPHNRPLLDAKDRKSLLVVLQSQFIASGPKCCEFEQAVVHYLDGRGNACAVSNGTSALYMALQALDVAGGSEIIVPSYVCSALLNAIYMAKAVPVVVDINPDDFNISVEKARKALTRRTRAIIVPHMYGIPADLDKLKALGVPIVEDCAQAIGAEYKNRKVGTFGDISIFSFYSTKLLTTGYGGMAYSRNRKYIDKIKDYLNFDYRRNYYPRFNFQMSDIQAALGLSQLTKLDYFLKRRESIAKRYISALGSSGLRFQQMCAAGKRVYYRFVIRINKPHKLIDFLEKFGIQTIVPVEDWELLHRYLKLPRGNFPIAEEIAHSTISLPVYPALKNKEGEYIIKTVIKGLEYVK